MKVCLCDKNKGSGKIAKRLQEKAPKLDVKVKKCIDICGDCDKTKIARVDGKKVIADDTDELVKKILKKAEK
jgi:uncharacterized protein YuzB (UPF0349 family)